MEALTFLFYIVVAILVFYFLAAFMRGFAGNGGFLLLCIITIFILYLIFSSK